jgi:hypothetical protein
MIGVGLAATGAAAGASRTLRRRSSRPVRASSAATARGHGGRESRAGAGSSVARLGGSAEAGAGSVGTAERTVERAGGRATERSSTGRVAAARRRTGRAMWSVEGRPSIDREARPEGSDRVTRCSCAPLVGRLPRLGRDRSAGAAPAGAVARVTSFAGNASAGAGSAVTGAGCGAGAEGAGTTAGDGAAWRGGSSVNGST